MAGSGKAAHGLQMALIEMALDQFGDFGATGALRNHAGMQHVVGQFRFIETGANGQSTHLGQRQAGADQWAMPARRKFPEFLASTRLQCRDFESRNRIVEGFADQAGNGLESHRCTLAFPVLELDAWPARPRYGKTLGAMPGNWNDMFFICFCICR